MTRLFLPVALTFVVFAAASEPHLRIHNSDEDVGDNHHVGAGKFSIEKGIKCEGGFEKGKGGSKECKGGMKRDFSCGTKAEDMADVVASDLLKEVQDFMGDEDGFSPDEEAMKEMMVFDDDGIVEGMEDGFSKSVVFGGVMKAAWGCKVTYEMKAGKFSKKSECGFKVNGIMGPQKDAVTYEYFDE